ncbi:hypothetical protein ERJ75_000966700 [Trypanosoma vivax]|nr:hypothetical protein ERJ75_000966700 [Trypanosoma vivax]
MMRRAPAWFTHGRSRERFHHLWPWALSTACAAMYFFNREPFDELAGTVATKIRKPLLQTMEWIELHDVDPESMALELPPDMLFGPLEFSKQMRFLLAALRADNELADGYLARVLVDHMDLSLDQPIIKENEVLDAGGMELLDVAVDDFLGEGARKSRRHIFFRPDQFLRFVNFIAVYPSLTDHFIKQRNGVELVFRALKHSQDEYARVLALRSLCLFCFTQAEDGDVERRILQADGVRQVVGAYKQSSGDPTDTRYITLILSSLLRHYPKEGGEEFIEAGGIQATVNNLNITRYKGIPQHMRVLHDVQKLPPLCLGSKEPMHALRTRTLFPWHWGYWMLFPSFMKHPVMYWTLWDHLSPRVQLRLICWNIVQCPSFQSTTCAGRMTLFSTPELLAGKWFGCSSSCLRIHCASVASTLMPRRTSCRSVFVLQR